jgi:hypothetical protein
MSPKAEIMCCLLCVSTFIKRYPLVLSWEEAKVLFWTVPEVILLPKAAAREVGV